MLVPEVGVYITIMTPSGNFQSDICIRHKILLILMFPYQVPNIIRRYFQNYITYTKLLCRKYRRAYIGLSVRKLQHQTSFNPSCQRYQKYFSFWWLFDQIFIISVYYIIKSTQMIKRKWNNCTIRVIPCPFILLLSFKSPQCNEYI